MKKRIKALITIPCAEAVAQVASLNGTDREIGDWSNGGPGQSASLFARLVLAGQSCSY